MPYVIVNKKNIQLRDVIVAASNWIESMDDGKNFVYLPKAKCDKVQEFLENDTPTLKDWEKHECDILIRKIPTLGSAYKALNMVRRRGFVPQEDSMEPQYGIAVAYKRLKIDTAGNAQAKEIPVTIYESLTNDDDEQDMFLFPDADHVKEDPFGDVVPPLEQPLPVLSSALPVKPNLPAVVVEPTKAKPNENVFCKNLMMQGDKDPLGDVSTPTPKPSVVQVPDRMQTRSKPTPQPPPVTAKPIILHLPEQIHTASMPTPPVQLTPLSQIPNKLSVVNNNSPGNVGTGQVISGNYITGNFITGKVISGNVNNGKIITGKVISSNVDSGKFGISNLNNGKVIGNVAHSTEPPNKNNNQSPQLQNLLLELKNMIISNQAEIRRQVCEGFKLMQQSFTQLLEQQQWQSGCQNPECVENNRFQFNLLTTIEDVKRFEEQLKDVEYRTKLRRWIFVKLKMELDGWKRMDTMFGLMFDKALHSQYNWSGLFGKEAMQSYVNIRELFEFIATTPAHQGNMIEVATFFKQKIGCFPQVKKTSITVASAKAMEPVKPTAVHDAANNNTLTTSRNVSETNGTKDISYVECTNDLEVSMESRDEGSNQSLTDKSGTSSGGSQRKTANTFIISMDKMDRFEKQLSDKKVQQQVHKWVDKTFGSEPEVEKRLNLLLNRLMDVKVFRHFKWNMHACGQRRLVEYPNFIELFEYASRKVEGDKTVLNTELVASFFKKRLRAYAQQRKVQ